MADTNSRRRDTGSNYARFFNLGFTFVLMIAIPTVGGYFLDRLLGTLPLFLLVGLALGFAAGLFYIYQAIGKLGGG